MQFNLGKWPWAGFQCRARLLILAGFQSGPVDGFLENAQPSLLSGSLVLRPGVYELLLLSTVCCCSSCWNHVTLADALPCLLFDARMLLERAHVVHRIVVWSRACAPAALCFPRVKGAISWWVCSSQVGVGKGRSLAPASGVGYLEAWGPICLHSLSESPLLTYGVDGNW